MISYTNNRVVHVREQFRLLKKFEDYVTDKTGVKIINASFIADEPTIFGNRSEDYIRRELEWYESMSLNVNDIPGGPPKIWQQVADKNGFINSNYGWCIWSDENHRQYGNVMNELHKNPNSRRAIMIYTRPNMWTDYDLNGRSDFMCTNTVQYLLREDRLHAVVQMRSNDMFMGYRNDWAWQDHVLKLLANDLRVTRGNIYWNVGSLHAYERHFDLID